MDQLFEFVINHYILVGVFIALLAALGLLEISRGGKKVSPQATISLLNQDQAVVLDIRERKEYTEGHIVDSLNIPLASLSERMTELKKYEDRQIIVADKAGQHSAGAVKQLNAGGHSNVVRLAGGIAEWQGSNLPLKKKKSEPKGKNKNKNKGNKNKAKEATDTTDTTDTKDTKDTKE